MKFVHKHCTLNKSSSLYRSLVLVSQKHLPVQTHAEVVTEEDDEGVRTK